MKGKTPKTTNGDLAAAPVPHAFVELSSQNGPGKPSIFELHTCNFKLVSASKGKVNTTRKTSCNDGKHH